ncbi:hypothetical protein CS022_21635 [Veronia nyctiphanis]|uniref:Uncharacterized protein n=1 Tax=Veronia nyctiphanis TaxID=1278244 RepID=A0A4Q0YKJ3_9GAMM|nr:hypothetical protein [Veronia nyctiphanis]RXJ71146.1 hypothetical protein CS022_21635 [Veronia nyctiphanis]
MQDNPTLSSKRKEIETIQYRLRNAIKEGKYSAAATMIVVLDNAQREFETLFQDVVVKTGMINLV